MGADGCGREKRRGRTTVSTTGATNAQIYGRIRYSYATRRRKGNIAGCIELDAEI